MSEVITHIMSDETGKEIVSQLETLNSRIGGKTGKTYSVKWDKVNAQMIRADDAEGITTDTTNFKHSGSVNTLYDNPFDSIYPWCDRQLVNISIDKYMALIAAGGGELSSCVTKWGHTQTIDFDDADGVWVYTPEFWYTSYDSGQYRIFSISTVQRAGWVHSPARIKGRWLGIDETRMINGSSVHCLLPKQGLIATNIAMSTLHTYAKNYKATINNCFAQDSDQMLYLVEYANYNIQATLGNGVDDLVKTGIAISETATTSSTIKIPHTPYAIVGVQCNIGTTSGAYDIAKAIILSVSTADGIDTLTLNTSVTVTTANFVSIYGLANLADSVIGSMSGYIGTNDKSNVYYRGSVEYGNRWQYLLGLYRHTGDSHVYVANSEKVSDTLDALDLTKCTDTGLILPTGTNGVAKEGYIQSLEIVPGVLSAPPICSAVGGNSSNPVGDYCYVPPLSTVNTVCLFGATAYAASDAGSSYGDWHRAASSSDWNIASLPLLVIP